MRSTISALKHHQKTHFAIKVWTPSKYGKQSDQNKKYFTSGHQPLGSVDLVDQEQYGRVAFKETSENGVRNGQYRRQIWQLMIGQFESISPVR